MPIKDLVPIIDDRTYADLVAEARTRIPRYTPEWTDLNESDPGIALVELFAWMTELLIYRLGKVPQLNYLKFLELIGFELTPARPAIAEITFPVQKTFTDPYVIVPLGTQVATEKADEQGPVVFETDRALIALTAALDAVQVFEQPTFRDVSAANDLHKAGFEAFGPRAAVDAALLFGFNSPLPFPEVEIDLAVFTQSKKGNAPLFCTGGLKPAFAPATLAWEYSNGKVFLPLSLVEDQTAAFTRDGHVRLQAPSSGSLVRSTMGQKTDVPRYWIRARLVKTGYQVPPRLLAVRANTASATNAQTIELELLGGSNGRPDQVFVTTGNPVLAGTMELAVDEGEGFMPWTEVPDFFGSGPDDTHYVLNRSTGEVRFGDGTQGHIPVANALNPQNVRATRYRTGGGRRGNVDAGTLTSLMNGIAGIAADQVTNLLPSGGGSDEESLADARIRAQGSLRSRNRAVTPEDFETLAVESGGIARAKALPLSHPDFAGVEVPGVVSVVVVPDVPGPAPTPNAATLRTVCAYLDARRLLTTEVYVVPPKYAVIRVQADLIVDDDADLAAVQRAAQQSLVRYFDPLLGGEESTLTTPGPGWPFGGGVYYSLVTRRLLVDGVKRVANLVLQLGKDVAPPCTDLAIDANTLLENGDHQIDVAYDAGGTP
jgi:predicted phage baseplate assembly protein